MPLNNRKATCDICNIEEEEKTMNTGWPGWAIIQGIGAVEPAVGESVQNKHLETYICPECREVVSSFLTRLQGRV